MSDAVKLKADRRLYVTADRSRIVEEDDSDAAYLLCSAGKTVQEGDVEKYDLKLDEHDRVVWPGLELPEPEPADTAELKARREWVENRIEQLRTQADLLSEELDAIDEILGGDDSDRNTSGLPDDIPGLGELVAHGFASIEEVAAAEDLTVVDGIGDKTAAAIAEYLATGADDGA